MRAINSNYLLVDHKFVLLGQTSKILGELMGFRKITHDMTHILRPILFDLWHVLKDKINASLISDIICSKKSRCLLCLKIASLKIHDVHDIFFGNKHVLIIMEDVDGVFISLMHIFKYLLQHVKIVYNEITIQKACAAIVNIVEWLDVELVFFMDVKFVLLFDYKCHITEAKGKVFR